MQITAVGGSNRPTDAFPASFIDFIVLIYHIGDTLIEGEQSLGGFAGAGNGGVQGGGTPLAGVWLTAVYVLRCGSPYILNDLHRFLPRAFCGSGGGGSSM